MEGTVKLSATFSRYLVVAVLFTVQAQEEIPELMNMKFWSYTRCGNISKYTYWGILCKPEQIMGDGRWEISQGRKLTLQNADIN